MRIANECRGLKLNSFKMWRECIMVMFTQSVFHWLRLHDWFLMHFAIPNVIYMNWRSFIIQSCYVDSKRKQKLCKKMKMNESKILDEWRPHICDDHNRKFEIELKLLTNERTNEKFSLRILCFHLALTREKNPNACLKHGDNNQMLQLLLHWSGKKMMASPFSSSFSCAVPVRFSCNASISSVLIEAWQILNEDQEQHFIEIHSRPSVEISKSNIIFNIGIF